MAHRNRWFTSLNGGSFHGELLKNQMVMGQTIVQNPTWDVSLKTMEKKKTYSVCCFVDALTMLSLSRFHKSTCVISSCKGFPCKGRSNPPFTCFVEVGLSLILGSPKKHRFGWTWGHLNIFFTEIGHELG